MRGRDDHAAADQRFLDAQYQARLRAIAECRGVLSPELPPPDRAFNDGAELARRSRWDHLHVGYLLAEWPPSMLN